MSRDGIAGIDRDGRLEGAGLPGDALAVEDVAGPVDDQDIVGAVAVDVGHQGRGVRVVANWPAAVNVPSPLPSSTDTVLAVGVGDGQVGAAVAGEVARHDRARDPTPPRR